MVVTIKSMQAIRDVVFDLDSALAPAPDCLVLSSRARLHARWAVAAAAFVQAGMFHTIRHWRSAVTGTPPRVLWAGHGTGAAVATLLSYFNRTGAGSSGRAKLVTIGAPRIGNAAAQAQVESRVAHIRLVAEGDSVPQLRAPEVNSRSYSDAVGDKPEHRLARTPVDQHWLLRRPIPGWGLKEGGLCLAVLHPGVMDQARGRLSVAAFPELLYGWFQSHSLDRYLAGFVHHIGALARQRETHEPVE